MTLQNTQFLPFKPRRFRTIRTISALMLREISTTHGKSAFGYIWAIAEPAAGILLLTLIFSLALKSPPLGTNFPLFYASGLLPFLAYLDMSGKVAQSLRFSRPLLAFPAITVLDPILARTLLNGLTQALVMAIVFSGIIFGFGVDITLNAYRIVSAFFMAMALAIGLGTLNCYLFVRFPFWERIWGIVNRPLFFLSGVFFTFESIPQPYADYLWANPLIHLVGEMRRGIYVTYEGEYISYLYVYGIAGACFGLGLLSLRRYYRTDLHSW